MRRGSGRRARRDEERDWRDSGTESGRGGMAVEARRKRVVEVISGMPIMWRAMFPYATPHHTTLLDFL